MYHRSNKDKLLILVYSNTVVLHFDTNSCWFTFEHRVSRVSFLVRQPNLHKISSTGDSPIRNWSLRNHGNNALLSCHQSQVLEPVPGWHRDSFSWANPWWNINYSQWYFKRVFAPQNKFSWAKMSAISYHCRGIWWPMWRISKLQISSLIKVGRVFLKDYQSGSTLDKFSTLIRSFWTNIPIKF